MKYKLEVIMVDVNGEYEFAYLSFDWLEEVFEAIKTFRPVKFYAVDSYKIIVEDE